MGFTLHPTGVFATPTLELRRYALCRGSTPLGSWLARNYLSSSVALLAQFNKMC
jgi:hypothetical protein